MTTFTDIPKCPSCKADMEQRSGRSGELFFGCVSYPECKRAMKAFTKKDLSLAVKILNHPKVSTMVSVAKLRGVVGSKPNSVLPFIIGKRTPSGNQTLAVKLRNLLKKKDQPKKKKADFGQREIVIPKDGCETRICEDFHYHTLPYDVLNPVQTTVLDFVDVDCNVVIATSTSSGKTICAEMLMAPSIERGESSVLLSPLKAVSQEKIDDWTDKSHPWSEKKVEIATGDYAMTKAKEKNLEKADIIILTSEMLDSKSRRPKTKFLNRVGCLVIDEAHLLTMPGRGDALEVGLMRFSKINKNARIVLLSATMPNVSQLGAWLTKLNGKPTVVIKSDWRPTELTVHWVPYDHSKAFKAYSKNELSKIDKAANLVVRKYSKDKWICFVHGKKTGYALKNRLERDGVQAEFHSADLDKSQRVSLEQRFKHGDLRVIIATSGLAWGMNMPARRVCVVGLHRGMELVDPIDVKQEVGRAGRVGLDPRGDAYILVPNDRSSLFDELSDTFKWIEPIRSQLLNMDVMAFHLTAEIAEGLIKTDQDAVDWYGRSFSCLTSKIPPTALIRATLDKLVRFHILELEDGIYKATKLGKISSWLYYSPFDVSDWASNFRLIDSLDKRMDDEAVAWALGNVSTSFNQYLPKECKRHHNDMTISLIGKGIAKSSPSAVAFAYYLAITGEKIKPMGSITRQVVFDSERVMNAIGLIDKYCLRSLGEVYIKQVTVRIKNGCSWKEAALCAIPNIGGKRAAQLIEAGFKTIEDVANGGSRVIETLGKVIGRSALTSARQIVKERQQ